jgi:aerobic-type carbon monoxide dehydrogenase small subunit (CoxS/CutS family)
MTAVTCNGTPRTLSDGGDRLLIDVLRDDLELTGTKLGCGTGDCGACTVLLDGRPVNACLVYAAECDGAEIRTVEGLATDPVGRIVAEELGAAGAVQCGICTPGFVVMATALLRDTRGPLPREAVEDALAGNLCRCTGYRPIVDAVRAAADRLAAEGAAR